MWRCEGKVRDVEVWDMWVDGCLCVSVCDCAWV